MPPPGASDSPRSAGHASSSSSGLPQSINLTSNEAKNLPLHAQPQKSSRSPSQTPRMTSATLPTCPPQYDSDGSASRTINEVIDTVRAPTTSRRPRGHSTSTEPSPPILQQSSSSSSSQIPLQQAKSHQSHVSFPHPSTKSTHSSGTATPAQGIGKGPSPIPASIAAAARAADMGRVASSPLPSTNTDHDGHSSHPPSTSGTGPRSGSGRSFSFSRVGSSRGRSPSNPREWFSRLSSSAITRRGRPRAGSESAMRSTVSVNVAEVASLRIKTAASEISSGPTLYPALETGSDIFSYNVPHADKSRTVDTGYGFEASEGQEEEETFTARGLRNVWYNSEQRRPRSSGSVFDSEDKGGHKSRSRDRHHSRLQEDEALRTTREVSTFHIPL